jgi:hypothetical protein
MGVHHVTASCYQSRTRRRYNSMMYGELEDISSSDRSQIYDTVFLPHLQVLRLGREEAELRSDEAS